MIRSLEFFEIRSGVAHGSFARFLQPNNVSMDALDSYASNVSSNVKLQMLMALKQELLHLMSSLLGRVRSEAHEFGQIARSCATNDFCSMPETASFPIGKEPLLCISPSGNSVCAMTSPYPFSHCGHSIVRFPLFQQNYYFYAFLKWSLSA